MGVKVEEVFDAMKNQVPRKGLEIQKNLVT